MKQDEVIIYRAKDGNVGLEVRMESETVWLSLDQMAKLFKRDKSTLSRHISNIFKEKELQRNSVVAFFATTAADGKTYQVEYYNLDVIISVGYRVKSKQGVQFRQWATSVLREHLLKGYTFNQKRLEKNIEALRNAQNALNLLQNVVENRTLTQEETRNLVQVIQDYARALTLLDEYDQGTLRIEKTHVEPKFTITYDAARRAIKTLQQPQSIASTLFGKEKTLPSKALWQPFTRLTADAMFIQASRKKPRIFFTSSSKTIPLWMAISALPHFLKKIDDCFEGVLFSFQTKLNNEFRLSLGTRHLMIEIYLKASGWKKAA